MKNFKDYMVANEFDGIPLMPIPTHGKHSIPSDSEEDDKIPMIPDMVHGKHSFKEENEHNFPPVTKSAAWSSHSNNENSHLGNNVEEVHQKLDMPREKFESTPSYDHVHNYTCSSNTLNRNLIKKAKGMDPFKSEKWEDSGVRRNRRYLKQVHNEKVKDIDEALKHHTLDHDLHVYHGTDAFNPDELAKQHPQRKIKSAAYMSTSIDKEKAMGFAGKEPGNAEPYQSAHSDSHILHVHLKKGQHGMYLGSHSNFEKEKEFLLPRNTTMKVHPEPTVMDNGVKVWHAHVVGR